MLPDAAGIVPRVSFLRINRFGLTSSATAGHIRSGSSSSRPPPRWAGRLPGEDEWWSLKPRRRGGIDRIRHGCGRKHQQESRDQITDMRPLRSGLWTWDD